METVAQKEWQGLFEKLAAEKGTVLLLGATDTGKSTLVRYMITRLVETGTPVSLVDADIGQSSLGLPGTISLQTFHTPAEVEIFRFEQLSFVGAVSPARIIPLVIEETHRMALLGKAKAEITLIDTTGLVAGELGRELKLGKIGAIGPGRLIAIERHDELRHILTSIEDIPVSILKPSPMVKVRSQEARSRYRLSKLAAYFASTREFFLSTRDVRIFYRNRPAGMMVLQALPGTLIGLNHGDETLGLGIAGELDEDSATFRTPLTSLHKINRVILGDITV
ncbi:MAG: GTPase or GTP-binding protein-like [Geobacteraceae bacterium]|nr:MAG: GTPase or GTP-binding protein-like [Geobacteraceae bacterium]